jgi:serine/threonine protein kinase
MASVWVARDERLGREVAVKILSDALAGEESYRRRFEREARVAAGLNHPGLVGIHDFGEEAGVEASEERPRPSCADDPRNTHERNLGEPIGPT